MVKTCRSLYNILILKDISKSQEKVNNYRFDEDEHDVREQDDDVREEVDERVDNRPTGQLLFDVNILQAFTRSAARKSLNSNAAMINWLEAQERLEEENYERVSAVLT